MVSGQLPISADNFQGLKTDEESTKKVLQFALWRLEALRAWNKDAIFAEFKTLADAMDVKIKDFMAPIFIAIAGTTASISVTDAMELIGSDMSRARLRFAVDALGGVGKKVLKRFEKEYQQLAQGVLDQVAD